MLGFVGPVNVIIYHFEEHAVRKAFRQTPINRWFGVLVAASASLAGGNAAATVPDVLVSIKPVHSLVAGVMEGVGQPALLIEGSASPHMYAMAPSDARKIRNADLIFWIGAVLESSVQKALRLVQHAAVVEVITAEDITVLSARQGGVWGDPEHQNASTTKGHHADPHVWLDPDNARQIVRLAVAKLSEIDRRHASVYEANGKRVLSRLQALDSELKAQLSVVREAPYVVFHDAFQAFEHHFRTNAVGAVTVSPERPPGARRLREIRAKIIQSNARCVFTEPQFKPAVMEAIVEGISIKTAVLDPLGVNIVAGADAYFVLMKAIADTLSSCLSD